MFGESEDFYFDMNFGSSPIIKHNEDNYEIQISSPIRFADLPDFDYNNFDLNNESIIKPSFNLPETQNKINEIKNKPKRCSTPKNSKKQPLIFKPFASFDATETTVNTLKECFSKNLITRCKSTYF